MRRWGPWGMKAALVALVLVTASGHRAPKPYRQEKSVVRGYSHQALGSLTRDWTLPIHSRTEKRLIKQHPSFPCNLLLHSSWSFLHALPSPAHPQADLAGSQLSSASSASLGRHHIPFAAPGASPGPSTRSTLYPTGQKPPLPWPAGRVVRGVPVDWVPVRGRLSMSSYMATILIVYSEPGLRPCSSAVSSSPPGAGNSSWIPSSGLE